MFVCEGIRGVTILLYLLQSAGVTAEERGIDISLPLQHRCEVSHALDASGSLFTWALKPLSAVDSSLEILVKYWCAFGFFTLSLAEVGQLAGLQENALYLKGPDILATFWDYADRQCKLVSGAQGPFLVQQSIYHWNLSICVEVMVYGISHLFISLNNNQCTHSHFNYVHLLKVWLFAHFLINHD